MSVIAMNSAMTTRIPPLIAISGAAGAWGWRSVLAVIG
jgi:hypothetical protein